MSSPRRPGPRARPSTTCGRSGGRIGAGPVTTGAATSCSTARPSRDYRAPEEATRPPAQRALAVLAGIFADNLDLPTDDPEVRRRAVAAWTRAHGLVHLELHGHLGAVGVDLDALFEEEVASLLDAP